MTNNTHTHNDEYVEECNDAISDLLLFSSNVGEHAISLFLLPEIYDKAQYTHCIMRILFSIYTM